MIGGRTAAPEDEGPLLAGFPIAAAVIGVPMCASVSRTLVGRGRMNRAAMAASSVAVVNSDPCAVGVVAARAGGVAAVAIAATAVTAMPSVEAIAATPAEPTAVGVAAPIEARSLPTAIVPAVIVSAEDELNTHQRRRVAGPIDPKDQL
jgi:hypothetical protein